MVAAVGLSVMGVNVAWGNGMESVILFVGAGAGYAGLKLVDNQQRW